MKRRQSSIFMIILALVMLFCACAQEQDVSVDGSGESSLEFEQLSSTENPPAMPWDEGIIECVANENDLFYTVAKERGQELHLKRGKEDVVLLAAVEFDAIIPSPEGSKVLFSADGEIHIYYYDTQKIWEEEIYGLPEGFSPKTFIWLDEESYIFTAGSESELGNGAVYTARAGGGQQHAYLCINGWSRNLHIEDMVSDGEVLTLKVYNFDDGFTSHEVLYYIVPLDDIHPLGITLIPDNAVKAESYEDVITVELADIVATPEEIKSVSGGREYSYEELIAMTPDEISKEIFAPAIEHYHIFTGLDNNIRTNGNIELNVRNESGEIEKMQFAVCADEEIPTYEAFIAETRKYFARELAAEYLYKSFIKGGTPYFIDYNGVFMYMDGLRGANLNYISTEYSIESHSESEIVYLATFKYIKDEFYDIVDNNEATDEQCDFEEFRYRFVLVDGKWVFENFYLGY